MGNDHPLKGEKSDVTILGHDNTQAGYSGSSRAKYGSGIRCGRWTVSRKTLALAIFGALAVVAIAVGLGVGLGSKSSETSDATTTPPSPTDEFKPEPTVGPPGPGFETIVTPRQIHVMFGDWGLNYGGATGLAAAEKVHKDIMDAIKMSPKFATFCNGPDKAANQRESAAFFANVRKETGGLAFMEEQGISPGQYCSSNPLSGASTDLQTLGKSYPCTAGQSYHGRGAIQLTWNFNYGRFSEFLYGDKSILLANPGLVVPSGPMGWAATLWFWMTAQKHGGQCPPKQNNGFLEVSYGSCHYAMQRGPGMGETISIINGGYECCPTSSLRASPIARIESYLAFLGILGAPSPNQGCAPNVTDWGACDISQGCPLISQSGPNSCPVTNKCTSTTTPLWLGAEKVDVTRWTCGSCDSQPIKTSYSPPAATATTVPTATTAPTATTVPTATGTIPPISGGPGNSDGFEKTVAPRDILVMFSDWGLNYNGKYGADAAAQVHADIASAIRMHTSFSGFCAGPDPEANKREAAAFFSNVRKETGGLAQFEEGGGGAQLAGKYCTTSPENGVSDELKKLGTNYPCVPGQSYHGRGPIQLSWNANYGRFSEFLYGDKSILLANPGLVVPSGPMGWAATLWFWMTNQNYGGACPPNQNTAKLDVGTDSCHAAMQTGAGMGKTINIINGGYECCPLSSYRMSATARIQSYLDFCGILKVTAPASGCVGDWAQCGISEGCPLIHSGPAPSCPIKGTCKSSIVPVWMGAEKVDVTRWSCPSTC